MLVYYEDKGYSQGIIYLRQQSIQKFIDRAIKNHEVISFHADVKLPNFQESFNMNVMFYVPSFQHLINMDCLNCNKVNLNGSCCDGAPTYPFGIESLKPLILDGRLIPYVRKEFQPLLKSCQITKSLDLIYDYHCQTFKPAINKYNKVECPLRLEDRCGLHKYCLDNNIPYYIGKSCTWLFPSDVILELDKHLKPISILLFICCDSTRDITRWGMYGADRHCIDKDLNNLIERQPNKIFNNQCVCDKTKYFKQEDYKPAYKVFSEEFSYLVGEANFNRFVSMLEMS